MDWSAVLLGGGFVLLWLLARAVLRWVEVRAHLQVWGPDARSVAPAPPPAWGPAPERQALSPK
ncbi:MAG: hypothetical protein JOZ82_02235 [Marmoricola sp.]|nr:hypothetical protein [Marmoricola sp.]